MYLTYKNGYHVTITTKLNDCDLIKKIDDGEIFGFIKLGVDDVMYILLHYTNNTFINDCTVFDLFKLTDNKNFNIIASISGTPLAQFPDIFDISTSKLNIVYIKKYPTISTNVAYFESKFDFYKFLDYFFIKTYKCEYICKCIRIHYNIDIKIDDLFYFILNKEIYVIGENMLGTYRKGVFNIKTLEELDKLLVGENLSNYTSNIIYQNEIIFIDTYPLYK
jgi:hypothetical protein